jgi:hypothetical protein
MVDEIEADRRSCGVVSISAVYSRNLNLLVEAVWQIFVITVIDSRKIVNIGMFDITQNRFPLKKMR